MTAAQVVETSFTVNNSPIQDYVHPEDQTQPTFEHLMSGPPRKNRTRERQRAVIEKTAERAEPAGAAVTRSGDDTNCY